MDGFEAVARIRATEETQNRTESKALRRIPIIALTANAMAEDRQRCMTAGFDDYLAKPFKAEALIDIVTRWSAPTGASDLASVSPEPVETPEPQTGHESFDPHALDHIRALQAPDAAASMMVRVFATFHRSAQRLIGQIEAAIAQADASALRMAAHTLKSSSANIGAKELAKLSKELEARAVQGSVDEAAQLRAIQAEYEGVKAAIQAYEGIRESA